MNSFLVQDKNNRKVLHPVIDNISRRLAAEGYAELPDIDKDSGIVTWRKKFYDDFYISFSITPTRYNEGDIVEFDADIGVDSRLFAEIFNQMGVWKCDPYIQKPVNLKWDRVLGVSLCWLKLNAGIEESEILWRTTISTSTECAKVLVDEFMRFGQPLLDNINTIGKLSKYIRNLDSLPNHQAPKPFSADPYIYTALLMNLQNNKDAAITELNIGLKNELASNERLWQKKSTAYNEAMNMTQCRYRKFINYIKNIG